MNNQLSYLLRGGALILILNGGSSGITLKQQLNDKLIEHKQYIDKFGEDVPEIRNWKWSNPK
jgi:phosphoketolase